MLQEELTFGELVFFRTNKLVWEQVITKKAYKPRKTNLLGKPAVRGTYRIIGKNVSIRHYEATDTSFDHIAVGEGTKVVSSKSSVHIPEGFYIVGTTRKQEI